jgi:hypothetical protein
MKPSEELQRSLDLRGRVMVFFPLRECGPPVPPSRMKRGVGRGLGVGILGAYSTLTVS